MATEAKATAPAADNSLEDAIRELVSLGPRWAGHGLTLGKMALEASAHTLVVTANALGELSGKISEEVDKR